MTKKDLDRLKNKLPGESRALIAEKAVCSTVYVDKVLSGERKSLKIIKIALEIAEAHKEEELEITQKIKAL